MNSNQVLDMSGVACPMPLLKTKLALKSMSTGEVLKVIATDSGSWRDIPRFIDLSGHRMLQCSDSSGQYEFWIERGEA